MKDALTDDPALQAILDREKITETVTRIANHADAQEWELLRTCFTDEIDVDYTSLAGGQPSVVKVDDLITSWRDTLAGFDATQHQVTNFVVTLAGDEAQVNAYIRTDHFLSGAAGGDHWLVLGTYDYRLVRLDGGWRVRATKLTLKHLEGNNGLAEAARARVSQANTGSRSE